MSSPQDGAIRIEILQQLAEQAMTDAAFRADASADLPAALERYGYELLPQELALVLRFRRSLAEAGVDLNLVSGMSEEQVGELVAKLPRRLQRSGW